MLRAGELSAQRRITLAYIRANPTTLALIPRTKTVTGSGTTWTDGTPRSPQDFHLIPMIADNAPQPGLVLTSDGRQRMVEFVLLGRWDATVELWDYWTDGTDVYEVAELFPANGYEVRAKVVSRV